MPTKKRKQHLVRQRRLRRTKAHREEEDQSSPERPAPTVPKREPDFREKVLLEDIGKLKDPHFFPVWDLSLSEKTGFLLFAAGIHTIGDLCDKTENDLLEINGIGPMAIKKIKAALEAFGLSLRGPR